MNKLQNLSCFISQIAADQRLKPTHISLSIALCNAWIANQFSISYQVSRSMLMKASRIRSKATYHRVIRHLQQFGYLKYNPSYHPKLGSRVTLLFSSDQKDSK